MDSSDLPHPHYTDPDVFRESLRHSEAATGFTATLIEKDYHCSLILWHLFSEESVLVFKGGTCLSKVYVDFTRLSEDLDFVISAPVDTTRSQRRTAIEPIRKILEKLPDTIPGVGVSRVLEGHNESRQYIGYLEYPSAIINKREMIKIEIGLREPLIISPETRIAYTVATNPFTRQPLLPEFPVNAMASAEIYAEKFRAALTRREPAIRDFFDLFQAIIRKELTFRDPHFVNMVREKILIPGNDSIDISAERRRALDRQLNGQLRPVLRPSDLAWFDLNEAFNIVYTMAEDISK